MRTAADDDLYKDTKIKGQKSSGIISLTEILIFVTENTEAAVQIFFKIGVLKNFANFRRKHLC